MDFPKENLLVGCMVLSSTQATTLPLFSQGALNTHVEGYVHGRVGLRGEFRSDQIWLPQKGHTMEWADSAFATAAKLDLATDIRTNLEAGVTLQRIHEYLQERVMNHARYINNYSTSSSANHMKHCQLAAMVDELEVVNGLMKHE